MSENFDKIINQIIAETNLNKEDIIEKLNKKEIIDLYDEHLIEIFLKTKLVSIDKFFELGVKINRSIIASNKEAFKYFISYVNCCNMIYKKTIAEISNKSPMNNNSLCIAIYGVIVRKSQQIVSLLIEGYIDAAMIIWRSLYESSISLNILLMQKDDELANKYMNHSIKNTKKKIDSFTKHHLELGFKPLDQETHSEVLKRELSAKDKYGKDFLKNEYGWADDLIKGKTKASLRLLAEMCKMDYFRPYYLLCSDHTHSGFDNQKLFHKNGVYYLDTFLNPSITKEEFIDPMQFTIAVLQRVNDQFLHVFSISHEYLININLLKEIADNLLKQFNSK